MQNADKSGKLAVLLAKPDVVAKLEGDIGFDAEIISAKLSVTATVIDSYLELNVGANEQTERLCGTLDFDSKSISGFELCNKKTNFESIYGSGCYYWN